ncbi:hypothetical protein UFOVP981_26 [uncultured Caudovirales phage]|uniref:Uncharacterized protein n=1 Tax=uncultured Caudovirales phage TaxID=2100421 RepID=A0A6J5PVU5_9CAUD|nr:hypothetical protein UFOVP981_26 [uncultured Caudovirales phage]CAB4222475.1 hypothetical protein UFOVP1652_12 [uncultured Caudovirales phage]
MANYAVIENGIVTNVIVATTKKIAESITGKDCVSYDETNPAGIGWAYDGKNFIAPKPVIIIDETIPE